MHGDRKKGRQKGGGSAMHGGRKEGMQKGGSESNFLGKHMARCRMLTSPHST